MPRYRVYVLPEALRQIDRLPGHVRSRVRHAILALEQNAQPSQSKQLAHELAHGHSLYRLRLDDWPVVYLLDSDASQIYVLAVRRRPPYSYEDLDQLAAQVE